MSVVDTNDSTSKGEDLSEGSQDGRVDDTGRRNDERSYDERHAEGYEHDSQSYLNVVFPFHIR